MFNPADPGPDYELVWPRDLFAAEAAAVLLLRLRYEQWVDDAELLLEEAFTRRVPAQDLRNASIADLPRGGLTVLMAFSTVSKDRTEVQRGFLQHLIDCAASLPAASGQRPYWLLHHAALPSETREASTELQRRWSSLVEEMRDRGYLDEVAARPCTGDEEPSAATTLDAQIQRRLGLGGLWPMGAAGWDADTFYSLVEVVHDLLARPRHRSWHEGCGWHYSAFAAAPARSLYRVHVDQLLARYGVDLHVAAAGQDAGRLVRIAGTGRDDLVQRVLLSPDSAVRDDVGHAITLFRGRAATAADRRSAVIALAGVLERNRALLKDELLSKDEGALFHIANQFDLRHRGKIQRSDYDPVFLDWVFWWYLATVELTGRLLDRQEVVGP